MNTIELSQLSPFLRLSSVEYILGGNGEIKNIVPYNQFDFLKTEIQSENHKGYYLREREFEVSEIRLLMDAVFSFHGISPKQTTDIISKIQRLIC